MSDHASISGSLWMGEVARVDLREVIDWEKLAVTLLDEHKEWYGCLEGETAYHKLLDLRWKHLKKLRVCGKSKRWWSDGIAKQLAVVSDYCRRHRRNGE